MSEEWRKEFTNKYFQFEEIGDSITGIFTSVVEEEYMGKPNFRPVLTVNNEEKILPGHIALLRALQPISYGENVEITLKERIKNKYNKTTNIYSVHIVEKENK